MYLWQKITSILSKQLLYLKNVRFKGFHEKKNMILREWYNKLSYQSLLLVFWSLFCKIIKKYIFVQVYLYTYHSQFSIIDLNGNSIYVFFFMLPYCSFVRDSSGHWKLLLLLLNGVLKPFGSWWQIIPKIM